MRPLLKWAGGKSRLAEQIAGVFGARCEGTYFEPFLGSASVFLYLKSHGLVDRAVLADINPKLIAVHLAVRDQVDDVLDAFGDLPSDDWRERYYDIREAYNEGPWSGPEHAARFFWLNRAGFNGLYRENRRGLFNVPVGSYKRLSLPSRDRFHEVSEQLQDVELISASFEEVMRKAGPEDHVYCDPPYVPLSATASFTGYCSSPFGLHEQRGLAKCAQDAGERGARVVLSNHDLPIVREDLYATASGFEHAARPRVARAISRAAHKRHKVTEMLAVIGPVAGEKVA
jgi:DNA adenine methylase